jgi:sporulation protein YlmC with PRC-barrel domain
MVSKLSGKYVVNEKGKAVSVLLDIKTYRRLITELEELEAIRAYDAAKASCDEAVPFEQAVQEIEKSRQ